MLGIDDSGGITVEWEKLFGFFLVFIYLFIYLLIYLLIYCVCIAVYISACTSHTKHAKVRGQLRESVLSLNCVGSCFVSVSLLIKIFQPEEIL